MATLAPSLRNLEREVNSAFSRRDHWSDGWLGDNSHASRFSDHNPDESVYEWVHAYDFDATLIKWRMGSGPVGDAICSAILKLCRSGKLKNVVNYIIYKGRIWSRKYNFAGRVYTLANKHFSHVHISILRTAFARNYSGDWGIKSGLTGGRGASVRPSTVTTTSFPTIGALACRYAMANKKSLKNGRAFKRAIAQEVGRGTMLLSSPVCGAATRKQYKLVQIKYLKRNNIPVTRSNANGLPPSTPTGSLRWLASRRRLKVVK